MHDAANVRFRLPRLCQNGCHDRMLRAAADVKRATRRLALKAPARRQAIEIAVEVELQHHRRVIGWPACRRRIGAFEPERRQIKLVDEGVDDPHRVGAIDIVVEPIRRKVASLRFCPRRNAPSAISHRNPSGVLRMSG